MEDLYLIAKTDRQLSIGLKFLYAQNVECYGKPFEIKKGKMAFEIHMTATKEQFEELERQYLLITS